MFYDFSLLGKNTENLLLAYNIFSSQDEKKFLHTQSHMLKYKHCKNIKFFTCGAKSQCISTSFCSV